MIGTLKPFLKKIICISFKTLFFSKDVKRFKPGSWNAADDPLPANAYRHSYLLIWMKLHSSTLHHDNGQLTHSSSVLQFRNNTPCYVPFYGFFKSGRQPCNGRHSQTVSQVKHIRHLRNQKRKNQHLLCQQAPTTWSPEVGLSNFFTLLDSPPQTPLPS